LSINFIIKKIRINMKKVLSLIAVAFMFSLVSCGPSAEEKEAEAKRVQDSIASAESALKAAEEAMAAAAAAATADTVSATVADTVKSAK
jgi:hypothetical protein